MQEPLTTQKIWPWSFSYPAFPQIISIAFEAAPQFLARLFDQLQRPLHFILIPEERSIYVPPFVCLCDPI